MDLFLLFIIFDIACQKASKRHSVKTWKFCQNLLFFKCWPVLLCAHNLSFWCHCVLLVLCVVDIDCHKEKRPGRGSRDKQKITKNGLKGSVSFRLPYFSNKTPLQGSRDKSRTWFCQNFEKRFKTRFSNPSSNIDLFFPDFVSAADSPRIRRGSTQIHSILRTLIFQGTLFQFFFVNYWTQNVDTQKFENGRNKTKKICQKIY